MSAALEHPIGSNTIMDWSSSERPADGGRLELIWGYFHIAPPPSGQHQYAGDELRALIKAATRAAGRGDLYVVTGVGLEISASLRTVLIPDVVVLNQPPVGPRFSAKSVELVVEIWSSSNNAQERETKTAAYEGAGIPYFWSIAHSGSGIDLAIHTYRLEGRRYVDAGSFIPGNRALIQAAPVPVTCDPADLLP
jgi:Uma2 family endonuclease